MTEPSITTQEPLGTDICIRTLRKYMDRMNTVAYYKTDETKHLIKNAELALMWLEQNAKQTDTREVKPE